MVVPRTGTAAPEELGGAERAADQIVDARAGHGADQLPEHLPLLQHEQRRQVTHAEALGERGAGVHVDDADLPPGVRVLGRVPQEVLDAELADAVALVQPSLHEGYGLPVAEALAGGVPVVASPVPAVTELGPAGVPTFDPRDVADMAARIDETVELVDAHRYWERVDRAAWLADQPTDADLARQVLGHLATIAGFEALAPAIPTPTAVPA